VRVADVGDVEATVRPVIDPGAGTSGAASVVAVTHDDAGPSPETFHRATAHA
jgi:hypothetical protein